MAYHTEWSLMVWQGICWAVIGVVPLHLLSDTSRRHMSRSRIPFSQLLVSLCAPAKPFTRWMALAASRRAACCICLSVCCPLWLRTLPLRYDRVPGRSPFTTPSLMLHVEGSCDHSTLGLSHAKLLTGFCVSFPLWFPFGLI